MTLLLHSTLSRSSSRATMFNCQGQGHQSCDAWRARARACRLSFVSRKRHEPVVPVMYGDCATTCPELATRDIPVRCSTRAQPGHDACYGGTRLVIWVDENGIKRSDALQMQMFSCFLETYPPIFFLRIRHHKLLKFRYHVLQVHHHSGYNSVKHTYLDWHGWLRDKRR